MREVTALWQTGEPCSEVSPSPRVMTLLCVLLMLTGLCYPVQMSSGEGSRHLLMVSLLSSLFYVQGLNDTEQVVGIWRLEAIGHLEAWQLRGTCLNRR